MRRVYLISTVAMLSSLWVVAQNEPPTTLPGNPQQYPSAPPSQQKPPVPPPPDTSQTATAPVLTDHARSVEGCIGGSSGSYTLTDASGKTWQLAGDTSGLGDHVGHTVEAWGSQDASGALNLKKVKMIASSCRAN